MRDWTELSSSRCLHRYAAIFLILTGIIGQTDVAAQQGPSPQKVMKRMDGNSDGKVARQEWRGQPQAFGKIDINNDSYLSSDELEKWFTKSQASQAGMHPESPSAGEVNAHQQARFNPATATIPWMDTHIHLRRGSGTYDGAAGHAIKLMNEAGIQTAILMPPPFQKTGRSGNRYDFMELSKIANAYPGRFLFMGGGHLINGLIESTPPDQVTESLREDFTRKANSILDSGARGFGELGMMHLGHFPGHPSYRVRPDHPLFLLLADIAGGRKAVIDIHMDVVIKDAPTPKNLHGSNPDIMKENLELFERFVSHNRSARIILAHAGWDVTGQWSAEVSRHLLENHPNLYMSLKVAKKGGQSRNQLMKGVFAKSVSDDWLAVVQEFPDRFVIGSDSFIAEAGARGKAPGGMTMFNGPLIETLLEKLPQGLARQIAVENVVTIYGEP